jgi:hypothetical protein
MKTPSLLTLFAIASLIVSPPLLRAAEAADTCSTSAPINADAVVIEIEIKVIKAQYEKVLASLYDAQLEVDLNPGSGTSEEQAKAQARNALKVKVLEAHRAILRDRMTRLIEESNAGLEKGRRAEAK